MGVTTTKVLFNNKRLQPFKFFFFPVVSSQVPQVPQIQECHIPFKIRGSWFSWENGQNTLTEFNADSMTKKGHCIASLEEYHVNYTFVFQNQYCYFCVKILVRTVNVLEKMESKCRR